MISISNADDFGRNMPQAQIANMNRNVFKSINAQPGGWAKYVDGIARRIWEEAVTEALQIALPSSWLAQAEAFEAAGTPDAMETARTCRRHAWLLSSMAMDEWGTETVSLVAAERWGEVA